MFNLINTNRLIASDSYKTSQFPVYPEYMDGMFAYGEARKANEIVVSAGICDQSLSQHPDYSAGN